jgi:hypothetical protein
MSENVIGGRILDSYHNDVTPIVEAREPARRARKIIRRRRYQRHQARLGFYRPRFSHAVLYGPMPDFTEVTEFE